MEEIATKAKESEDDKVEIDLPEVTVTLDLILSTTGQCSALGNHFFYYSQKASEDKIRTTWENLVHNFGTIHGQDISNKLLNKKTVIISKPDHTQYILYEHQLATEIIHQLYQRIEKAWQFHEGFLEDQVIEGEPAIATKAKISLAILNT